jgi:hypothetical protein
MLIDVGLPAICVILRPAPSPRVKSGRLQFTCPPLPPFAASNSAHSPVHGFDEAGLPSPAVANEAFNAGELASQAAKNDQRQRTKKSIGEAALAAGLVPGNHRHQKNARGEIRRRRPEDRQLQMSGAPR